jgi:predicted RNA-binding Zn ribbon-like protein
MRAASRGATDDWIDGFLFVANRLVLDFLNTKPALAGGPSELLADAPALERWLIVSGIAASPKTRAIMRKWRHSAEATAFLKRLIAFRERLRAAVAQIENGSTPSNAFLAEVNSLLLQYPCHTSLRKRDGKVIKGTFFEPLKPDDFWAPIVNATADLLSEAESSRIRKCESCDIHFFDTSKKGSRRWCSMNICGNKLKVAAYRRRKRNRDAS